MTEFMDLTSVAKLYGDKGEYSKLYDNQGRVIWQSAPTIIWQGGWSTYPISYNPLSINFDKLKFARVIFQFEETIVNISISPSGAGLGLASGRAVIPISLITGDSYLTLYKKGYENNPNTFKISATATGFTLIMQGGTQPTVTLTTVYAE